MGAASYILQGLGAAAGTVGSGMELKAQLDQNTRDTVQAKRNAAIARFGALSAREKGGQQEMQSRLKYGQLRADQQVAYAAGGVVVGEGSAADAAAQTQRMSDYDAAVIRNNAAREAWGYQQQASQFDEEAKSLQDSRDSIKWAGGLNMLGTALGSGSSMMGSIASKKKG